jgi:hypothetical protein
MHLIQPRQLLVALGLWAVTGLASSCWASDGAIDAAAHAKPFVVGQVVCSVIGDSAAEPGSVAQGREVSCQFKPGIGATTETYIGTLRGAGQVDALFGRGVVMLLVKQVGSNMVAPGMLEQTYSADATTRAGRSTPLIGDTNNSLILQPLIERAPGEDARQVSDALLVQIELKLRSSVA